MFENFKWKDLNKLPKSVYRDYSYEVETSDSFDKNHFFDELSSKLKYTDFSLHQVQQKSLIFGEKEGEIVSVEPCEAYVIESRNEKDKTYLSYNFSTLSGQGRPSDVSKIVNLITSCDGIQSVTKTKDTEVYKLSKPEYKAYIINHMKPLTTAIVLSGYAFPSNDKNTVWEEVGRLGTQFALEKSLPREGVVYVDGEIDITAMDSVQELLMIEHSLGYFNMNEKVYEYYNKQTESQRKKAIKEKKDDLGKY